MSRRYSRNVRHTVTPNLRYALRFASAAAISVCGPAAHRAKQGASARPQMVQTDVDRATGTPAPARPRRVAVLIPAHRAAAVGGVRVEIAGCQGAIADSATAGDRRRCQRERSQTVPRRPIADGASVNDRGPWHRGRSRTVPARTIVDRASAGGNVAPLAEMPMGSRCAMALESGLSTVRSSTRPLLARPRLS